VSGVYLFIKMVVMPAITIPLALWFDLNTIEARSAVLIASLPSTCGLLLQLDESAYLASCSFPVLVLTHGPLCLWRWLCFFSVVGAVAVASFSLAKIYERGKAEMSSSIVLGTLLMVPVAAFWDWFVVETGVFE